VVIDKGGGGSGSTARCVLVDLWCSGTRGCPGVRQPCYTLYSAGRISALPAVQVEPMGR